MGSDRSFHFYSVTRSALPLLLAIGVGMTSDPSRVFAQEYEPPDRGFPGRREGGGTRGECLYSKPSLTALMPATNFGFTVAEYPTFFWYIPANAAIAAEFVLLDANNTEVYQTILPVPDQSGILSFKLPANELPPLEVGKDYRWYFSLVCNPEDRSVDLLTEGWIQRIQPDADLVTQLEQAAVNDRPSIYAEAGIWYEAVASLADLRRSQPEDSMLLNRWRTLLNSVDLENLADQPLLP